MNTHEVKRHNNAKKSWSGGGKYPTWVSIKQIQWTNIVTRQFNKQAKQIKNRKKKIKNKQKTDVNKFTMLSLSKFWIQKPFFFLFIIGFIVIQINNWLAAGGHMQAASKFNNVINVGPLRIFFRNVFISGSLF